MRKQYLVKIYSFTGAYIKTLNSESIKNDVRFTSRVNGGQGECVLDLNFPLDDFDEGAAINYMNIVRIYESDDQNSPTPRLIYTGFISQYAPYFDNGSEGVRVTLLGLGSLLAGDYFKNGSNFTVNKSSTDPAQIMRDIIDHFNSIYPGNWLSYGSNVTSVGINVTYSFVDQKWMDALKKTFDLAGGGRYWKISESGELHFKVKPSSATHRFTLGKDILKGEVLKNSEQIVNAVQVRPGAPAVNTDFSDATSVSDYGRRGKIVTDGSITDATTVSQRGNQDVTDSKNPKVQARLTVNSTYDIETIKPGDTCSVFNTKQGSSVFPANMLITSVSYGSDGVDIELENTASSFSDKFRAAVESVQ